MMQNLDFINFSNALKIIYSEHRFEDFKRLSGKNMRYEDSVVRELEVEDETFITFRYKVGLDEGKQDFRVWYNSTARMYQLRTDKFRTRLVVKDFCVKGDDHGKEKLDLSHYFINPLDITEDEFMLFSMVASHCIRPIKRLSYAQNYFVNRRN